MSFKIGAGNILNRNNRTPPSPLANQLSNSFGNQEDPSLNLKISEYADQRFQTSTFTTFGKTNSLAKRSSSPSICSNRTPVNIATPVPPAPPVEGINLKQPFRKNPSSQEEKTTSSNSAQSGINLNAILLGKARLKNTKTEGCTNSTAPAPYTTNIKCKTENSKQLPNHNNESVFKAKTTDELEIELQKQLEEFNKFINDFGS